MRMHDYTPRPAQLKWLLDSDPGIRWQTMRDLTDEEPAAIATERARVATEGWGAKLLAPISRRLLGRPKRPGLARANKPARKNDRPCRQAARV